MGVLEIVGGVVAFGVGIYIGLGFPGLPGPKDRVLPRGMRRRRHDAYTPLDWLRPRKR